MRLFFYCISILFWITTISAQNCIDSTDIYTFFYNGNRYEVVKENKTWVEAAACADARGGILSHIDSQEEMDSVFFHVNNSGIITSQTQAPDGGNAAYIWIGGNDMEEEGKWIWDGSNYGLGVQFWQGDTEGSIVDSLYNNWGNEPDNFGNQDGLGLALTNWPRGTAGQWNDVNTTNLLFYLIEYDNSTVQLEKVKYFYPDQMLAIYTNFKMPYDSIQITINELHQNTFFNVSLNDTILYYPITFDVSQKIGVWIFAYKNGKKAISRKISHEVYAFQNPVSSYLTDFEDAPVMDFIGDGFTIEQFFGFRDKAIHSHSYPLNTDYTFTLIKPVIVSDSDARMVYSDVALVEPGEVGSVFGEENFKDYVIVEGTKSGDLWLPLADGYDARYSPVWEQVWSNGGIYRNMFVSHTLDLGSTFNPGDTILIRFRFYSDAEVTGWGWVIDSLQVQDQILSLEEPSNIAGKFDLKQNYPNPFNPITVISYSIPESQKVDLKIYDILGNEIVTLVEEFKNVGNHSVEFNASNLSSGVYFYKLKTSNIIQTKKLILLK